MSKKETIGYFLPPPVRSPQQLRNSINALSAFNPYDPRIERYQSMIPRAEEERTQWKATVRRIKTIIKG